MGAFFNKKLYLIKLLSNFSKNNKLQRLCRVCSNLIKNRIKKKNEHSSLFLTCFGIEEIEKEDCNRFPTNFCHNCYLKMKGTEKGKSTSLQLLDMGLSQKSSLSNMQHA